MNLQDIAKQIIASKNVLISAHTNPDGDAIGAMVAIGHFCAFHGIPYVILLESTEDRWSYLLQEVITAESYSGDVDTMVALDCGNTERLVGYEDHFKQANKTIVIDHHQTNAYYGQYNYIQAKASSTCELVYNLVKEGEVAISKPLAQALYTGLVTDTGGFMHSCTTPETMCIAAELMAIGIPFSDLYYRLIHEKSLQTIELQSIATSHMTLVQPGIYTSYLTQQAIEEVGATKEDIDGIVSFLKNIAGVELIAFLYPLHKGNGYKLSTRSNAPYDVAAFCQQFNGGGHIRAAGAALDMSLEQALQQIQTALTAF